MERAEEFYAEIARRTAQGATVALATIIRTKGSTPRGPGGKMLIAEDGTTLGTVGGGCGEAEVLHAAQEVIRAGTPRLVSVDLTADFAADYDVCGGLMEVFVEPFFPTRK
jgi:xanthine dehydrogenase accessory factor